MSTKIITREEFVKHHFVGDCWIEIEGKVYDVSEWMRKHPGGERLLECLGGKDASLPFLLNHNKWVAKKYLSSMFVGKLEAKQEKGKYDRLDEDFKILYAELENKGWFHTSYAFYAKKTMVLMAMFLGVIYLFHLSQTYDDLWPLALIGSVMMGMFWQQLAFMGHDLGHNGVTHSVFWDSVAGFLYGNLFQGISIGWWKYTHNVHHVRTNDNEWDPDIQHMPFIAISKEYLSDIWSYFHRQKLPPTSCLTWAISKIFIRYQHKHWFFTIMSSRLFVLSSSLVFVFWQQPLNKNGKNISKLFMVSECITLVLYHVWSLSLFIFMTDHPIFYYMVAYMTAGILHIQIIMNHFPCPTFNDIDEGSFVLHQLRSSMAIKSTTFTHWFYGGLQFQVEHHLFPMMPRHNLRKVKPYILALCKKYNLPYLENSFWGAIRDIGQILKAVAKHADKLNEIHFTMQKTH